MKSTAPHLELKARLLEAMAESQVTIESTQYPLQQPFIVIATQNPNGFEGTYPLPRIPARPIPISFVDGLSRRRQRSRFVAWTKRLETRRPSLNRSMHRDELAQLQRVRPQKSTVDPKLARYLVRIAACDSRRQSDASRL